MTPEQIRNANWNVIESHLSGSRASVHNALLAFGPQTTSMLALRMQKSILSVRPRVTELCALGLVECIGKEGHEGIYQAITTFTARNNHLEQQNQHAKTGAQLQLL